MIATRKSIHWAIVLIFLAWFITMAWWGSRGFFIDAQGAFGLTPVQLAIIVPQLLFLVAMVTIRPLAEFVRSANITFLVAIQVVRILALSHLVSWGYGLMAGGFALPVALGNLLVCALAMYTVVPVAQRQPGWQGRVLLLSWVGIAEFVMTIFLSVAGFFTRPLVIDPGMAAGGYVTFKLPPLSLFPTFAIPALLMIHFATLIALRHQRRLHAQ